MNRTALATAALLAAAAGAAAEVRTYVATLSARQEVPSNNSTAFGCGLFTIDTDANTVSYRIVYAGLTSAERFSHIHGFAEPGTNAPIKHDLPLGPVKVGVWNYSESDEADILAGRCYVNVHSINFGGGEIRGQIASHAAELDGAQEVPPVNTPARGSGVFRIDTAANTLSYYITYNGLTGTETAAHFHGPALHGTNAPVIQNLPAGNPKVGVWNYPESLEQALLEGRIYANIHTNVFPSGEIRGQVVTSVNPIDALQEVPPNNSTAVGCALFAINTSTDTLSYDITYAGLTSNERFSHIHGYAPPGTNAPIKHDLPLGARKLGSWNYPAADETSILDGLSYVNVHSINFGGGEIRGQVYCNALRDCAADFNGDGTVDSDDFFDFLNAFNLADPSADFNGDGLVDSDDFFDFLNAFNAGC